MSKYLYPFMLFITAIGFTNVAVEVCIAMWENNAIIAVCASIIIAMHWITMVEQYVSDRVLKK